MKKTLILILIAALVLGFCACGKDAGQDNELKTLAEEESISETESYTEPISEEITETETEAVIETGTLPETEPATLATAISQIISTTKKVITTTGTITTTTKPKTTIPVTIATKPVTTTAKPSTTINPTTTTRPIRSSTTNPSVSVTESSSSEVMSTSARQRYGEKFSFTTTDINGNTVSSSDFANAKLIMINRWEPWCGPCVNELSDLQKLYTNYKDKGFVLLGVFKDNPDDARTIVRQKGLTYPILNYSSEFYRFYTGSVPTTVFLDGEGYPLSSDPYVGARKYEAWEQIVLYYLG